MSPLAIPVIASTVKVVSAAAEAAVRVVREAAQASIQVSQEAIAQAEEMGKDQKWVDQQIEKFTDLARGYIIN